MFIYKKNLLRLILPLATALLFTANASAQNGRISLNLKNATLLEFFKAIESQSQYTFSFRDAEVTGKRITVNVSNAEIKDVLNAELSKSGLRYQLINGKIVVISIATDKNNSITLNGKVIDDSGEPIIGAYAFVRGTTNGVVTDSEGKFSIRVQKGDILEFSSLGYENNEYVIRDEKYVEIILSDDVQILQEAIAVGYGTTLRKNLTTSVATVKPENISQSAISNVSQLLLGQAAGLRANISSSQPGGYVSLSIRGGGTPIFVIDGVMMPSGSLEIGHGTIETPNSVNRAGLAGLNPGDIESIEILKDASASIYGINAANGVILITTKNGSEGAMNISAETNYSFVRNCKYMKPLNSYEYMNFANVFSKESYLLNHDMQPYGKNDYDGGWSPVFYPDQIENATNSNWLDYIFRNGSINNHSINISGGTRKVKYYLSGNYYDQVGTVINSEMKRYTFRTNLSAQIFPFMKINTILNINSNKYLNSNADGGGGGGIGKDALYSALLFPPNYSVYDDEGDYVRYRSTANPAEMSLYKDNTKSSGWFVNISSDINLYKDILSVQGVFGYNKEQTRRSLYIPTNLLWYEVAGVSRGHIGDASRDNKTLECMLNYKQKFGDILNLSTVFGMGIYNDSGYGLEIDYKNANDNIGPDNIAAAEGPFTPTSSKLENEKRSQFGRFSADFLDKYVVSATLRRDGTDKFFPGKKYSWFPSLALAWKISNEKFMGNVKWIDFLKLRTSWGKTGRDNLGSTLYGVYTIASSYVKFDNNSVTYIPYMKSGADYPDVTWEKTIMKNIGLDFYLLKNRIWGSVDIFRNDVTDLLGEAPGEPLSMVGTRPVNYGHYYRSGIDATINSINLRTSNGLTWSSMLTLTHYNMYWVRRTENYDYQVYQKRHHEPMNASYFYHTSGIINADKSNMPDSQLSLGEGCQKPGYPIIKDKNNDGIIDMNDIYMEDTLPDISIGFGNTFSYLDFDISIFLYGQFGAKKYNFAYQWANAASLSYGPPQNANQYAYWIWNSQTNTNGKFPGIASSKAEPLPGNAGWDIGREDASFIRVRNITFGYTLKGRVLGNYLSQRIESIRFFVDLQNPFTFTKFACNDPEIYTGSSSSPVGYPMSRSYSLGAKFNLK